jgi:hypothetical protein
MKHTMLNKILNALTFGLLNRIENLEHNYTMSVIENAGAFHKLDRVDTDVSALEKRVVQQGDSLTDLREHVRSVLNSESPALKEMIRTEAEAIVDDMVGDAIREKGLVREKDLPDFDDYWTDNDTFADRVMDIVSENADYTDRSDVRDIISEELDEKNYATKSDVEDDIRTAIETHEEVHHAEEDDESQELAPDDDEGGHKLNEMMKPIVLSGKMVSVPIVRPQIGQTTSLALTDTELALVLAHRAMHIDGEDKCDTWMEVIYNNIDGDDERDAFFLMLVRLASEYSYRYAVGLEGDAHNIRKEGRQTEATHLTIKSHGYEMAGSHLEKTEYLIDSLNGLADYVTDRIEDTK